jgi:transglutaminase-like putative cysteine protease
MLACAVALCVPLAASDSNLKLPVDVFVWTALLGVALGIRSAPRAATTKQWRAARIIFWLCIGALGSVLLTLSAADALPPAGLIVQDLIAFWRRLAQTRVSEASDLPMPILRSQVLLAESLPRFWVDLLRAPDNGEPGARLILATGGVLLTWVGALILGRALLFGRALVVWALPLLTALTLMSLFGGGGGLWLVAGFALLLLLAISCDFHWREAAWDRSGADFSTELRNDVYVWGAMIVIIVLLISFVAPVWLSNPIAQLLWNEVDAPSGIVALQENVRTQPFRPAPPAPVGLSTLPDVNLGQSLEQGPPNQIALRVQLEAPLPDTPGPHYWRARMLNTYTGRSWIADARVSAQEALDIPADPFPGSVVQTIKDARPNRQILIGLADIIAVDVPADAERLADGALTALTSEQSERYRVLSRPQEFAEPPRPEEPPPDLSAYLGLPRNLPPQVVDLARAVAGDAPTTEHQALALETYLRELPYSYAVQPPPGNGDAVEQFLFDMRQGYCTYYASAMAVMARSLGIPARVAIGYATGEYDAANLTYTVYEQDAHAWPELYVNGRWTPFEPTPIRPLPARETRRSTSPPVAATTPAAQETPVYGLLIWLAVVAVLAGLSAAGLWVRRRSAASRAGRLLSPAFDIHRQLEKMGVRAGIPWPTGTTLHEYGALLASRMRGAVNALTALIVLIERARYSGKPLTAAEERGLDEAWRQVRAQLEELRTKNEG